MQEALCFLSCGYGLETTHVTNTNLFRAVKRQSTSAVGGARSVVMKTVRWGCRCVHKKYRRSK